MPFLPLVPPLCAFGSQRASTVGRPRAGAVGAEMRVLGLSPLCAGAELNGREEERETLNCQLSGAT